MANIIIPVDFGENSENTIHYGIETAKDFGYRLTLLHVIDNTSYSIGYATHDTVPNPEVSMELLEEMKKQSEASFQKLTQYLGKKYNNRLPELETKVEIGIYVQKVLEQASGEADIIMVPGKVPDDFLSRLLSTETIDIVNNATCPVWVVPPEARYEPVKKIIYATDYQEEDIPTLQRVSELARIYGAGINALHIVKNEDLNVKAKQTGFQELVREKVGYDKMDVTVTMSNEGIERLDKFAEEKGAQLIVMLKENKSFLERIFEGSATKKLLMHSTLPVLIYHEQ